MRRPRLRSVLSAPRVWVALVAMLATGLALSVVRAASLWLGLALSGVLLVGWFLGRVVARRRQRALWRVSRRLLVSYVFISVVPLLLISVLFLLGDLLFVSNVSAHLLQSRLEQMTDRAAAVALTTAVELQRAAPVDAPRVLAQRQRELQRDFPSASMAVLTATRSGCGIAAGRPTTPAMVATAGPWAHVDVPRRVPDWVGCGGAKDVYVLASGGQPIGILTRAIAWPDAAAPTFAVVVDLVFDERARATLHDETGAELRAIVPDAADVPTLTTAGALSPLPRARRSALFPSTSATSLDVREWETGRRVPAAVRAEMAFSMGEVFTRISATQGPYGRALLTALLFIGVLFLVLVVLAVGTGLALARSVTSSVAVLFAGTERVRLGDVTSRVVVRTGDQLAALARAFNSMLDSIERLLAAQAEQQRLEDELRLASDIQRSLLPPGPFVLPGLEASTWSVPARAVGGDAFDILPLGDGRTGVLVADVSGKGVSAALYMAELKGLLLALSRQHASPRDLLVAADAIMATQLDPRSYITVTYAVVDAHRRTMTWVRAGHAPLLYVPATSGPPRAQWLAPEGMVLGASVGDRTLFGAVLEEREMALHPGDVCVLFTDGITEATGSDDALYGDARLAQRVEAHAHAPIDALRDAIVADVAAFVGPRAQHDDMTMVVLRVAP